ncbi:MAG: KH domain-containing protein [bacterium]
MAEKYSDQAFLEMLVKAIVSAPDKVQVERTVDEMGVLLTLKIDPADMGYVIGRRGQTAQAIRTLLKIVGAKNNARVNLKIYEPEGSQRPPRRDDRRNSRDEMPTADIDTSSVDELKI